MAKNIVEASKASLIKVLLLASDEDKANIQELLFTGPTDSDNNAIRLAVLRVAAMEAWGNK